MRSHRNSDETSPAAVNPLQQQLGAAAQEVPDRARGEEENARLSDMERELQRLRHENEVLRKGAMMPTGLSEVRGRLRLYRVRLPSCHPKRSQRVVTPRLNAPHQFKQLPTASFDDLDLFLHEAQADPLLLDRAAWSRYLGMDHDVIEVNQEGQSRTFTLQERHSQYFFVNPQQGINQDYLDIPAPSPADAFALFCKYCHIRRTINRPIVEDLGPVEEQAECVLAEPAGVC